MAVEQLDRVIIEGVTQAPFAFRQDQGSILPELNRPAILGAIQTALESRFSDKANAYTELDRALQREDLSDSLATFYEYTSLTHIDPASFETFMTPEVFGNIRELYYALKTPDQMWIYDWDKTLTRSRMLRDANGNIDPEAYYQSGDILTLMNIDQIIIKALVGHGQHICTGKDWNFYPMIQYIHKRTEYIAKKLNMTKRMDDGSLVSLMHEDQGVFIAVSTGNGAVTIDAIRGELLVLKPLPQEAWEGMAEAAALLGASTKPDRIATIRRVRGDVKNYPIYHYSEESAAGERHTDVTHTVDKSPLTDETFFREIAPIFSREEQAHIELCQAAIAYHGLFIPELGTKVNYVFDIDTITSDSDRGRQLRKMWAEATGVFISTDPKKKFKTFMEAFKVLSKNWNVTININEAHDTVYVDISAPNVNKGLSQRLVKNVHQYHIKRHAQEYAEKTGKPLRKMPKVLSFSLADNVHPELSNDKDILYRTRSMAVGHHEQRYPRTPTQFPVYAEDFYGQNDPEIHANQYLADSTILSCPAEIGESMKTLMETLNEEHFEKFRQYHPDVHEAND